MKFRYISIAKSLTRPDDSRETKPLTAYSDLCTASECWGCPESLFRCQYHAGGVARCHGFRISRLMAGIRPEPLGSPPRRPARRSDHDRLVAHQHLPQAITIRVELVYVCGNHGKTQMVRKRLTISLSRCISRLVPGKL